MELQGVVAPKAAANARPANGGRFSPAGAGTGLSWLLGASDPGGSVALPVGKRGSRFLSRPVMRGYLGQRPKRPDGSGRRQKGEAVRPQ